MARRVFTREFKTEAVRLAREGGVSKSQVARELGIHNTVLARWVREFENQPEKAFPGKGKPEDAELAKLRRELKRITAERDILKKALGYFAKEPT
jgi:transposase